MLPEPLVKRTIAYVDGQNLFNGVKKAFGYTYPNYDILALSQTLCTMKGWELSQVRFYTGVPDSTDKRHAFWMNKIAHMGRLGICTYYRTLSYRNELVKLPDGTELTFPTGREKGIDIRIAIDVIRMAHRNEYDVALIFSEDQDFSEVADEIRTISEEQARWIKVACAYPFSPTHKARGIKATDWIRIDKRTYDSCIDSRFYRP